MEIPYLVRRAISLALEEDIGNADITSSMLIPSEQVSTALVVAKDSFVVAGLVFAEEVFKTVDDGIKLHKRVEDGSRVRKGAIIAEVNGKTRSLLMSERVALNILQHLSGIATLTNAYAGKIKGVKKGHAKLLDTRKTKPCIRFMEKYAVRMGGGTNHRFGLYDGILIKDNHIEAVGSIKKAVGLAKRRHLMSKIEVEVENLKEFKDALDAGADIIMLDNMSFEDIREAVRQNDGKALLEASGNITLENIKEIAETGVDMISVGAITHSAPAVDISMKIVRVSEESL